MLPRSRDTTEGWALMEARVAPFGKARTTYYNEPRGGRSRGISFTWYKAQTFFFPNSTKTRSDDAVTDAERISAKAKDARINNNLTGTWAGQIVEQERQAHY